MDHVCKSDDNHSDSANKLNHFICFHAFNTIQKIIDKTAQVTAVQPLISITTSYHFYKSAINFDCRECTRALLKGAQFYVQYTEKKKIFFFHRFKLIS